VLPTLIELAELPIPEGTMFDGMSLASLLRGHEETLPDRTLVVQYSRPSAPTPYKWDAAVLWKRWRLINNTSLYDLSTDPRQTRNVMTRYPDVVAQMRSHYEAWWAGVAPTVNTLSRLTIGSDAANPVLLAATEWRNVALNQQYEVRTAPVKNGVWKIEVARGATYQVELRRWPVEADAEITAGLPPYTGVDGTYVEGKALPDRSRAAQSGQIRSDRTGQRVGQGYFVHPELAAWANRSPDMVPGRQRKTADRGVLRKRHPPLIA
jgi:hypothetical protein